MVRVDLPVGWLAYGLVICKWLKHLDSRLSPIHGVIGSNPINAVI